MPDVPPVPPPALVQPDLGADAVRQIGARRFDFARQVAVMAIINRTVDSFHDRGATFTWDRAVAAVERAVDDGAHWLDIGGVPFSPRAARVSEAEEIERVVPLVAAARERTDAVISVDTVRPGVARAALAAGADVLNDTSGLRDPHLADVVAQAGATLVLTHSRAAPGVDLPRPTYDDVVREVRDTLVDRAELAQARGVARERIIIDPGHDLNKNTVHSLELTRRLGEFAALGYPLLAAVSNKDFIQESLDLQADDLQADDLLAGTLAAVVFCVLQGARIVRVHDVRETVAAVRMTETMMGWREPACLRHNV